MTDYLKNKDTPKQTKLTTNIEENKLEEINAYYVQCTNKNRHSLHKRLKDAVIAMKAQIFDSVSKRLDILEG